MEYFEPSELRLVQERSNLSAADALLMPINPTAVPDGKIWTVLAVGYRPSVAETQTVYFYKSTRAGNNVALLNPSSMNLNPAYATCIEQGMAIILLPGETLRVGRLVATAGSTMSGWMEFIETDMPLYDYTEPQVAARIKRASTALRQVMSSAASGGGGGGGRAVGERPGPRPK